MKKNCLTLILPSLLSGCAGISGSNNVAPSDTPALVFVDGQISESAGVLALTQQRQPFVLFKGLTFQKLCLPGAFRPGDHHNKMLRPGLCVVHASPQYL